ncbi:zinc finger and SCAN domain-containing protein 12-like [Eublepharis macularius]|uniref:Zinc finger and SCAN domain-containing protein 12-like n=1 Tax=Eublepharis macularius TaxID=481883 RepID=A0AA97J6H3_EUBMA|nr:zinc finger and SCAN domain-containing protein 12-like [Eublepharis macularius]
MTSRLGVSEDSFEGDQELQGIIQQQRTPFPLRSGKSSALSGAAEQAFNSLDVRDREDYGKVKAAILRGDVLSWEKQRQQFRHFCYQEAEGPRGAYCQLREMCHEWLRVEKHSKEQILELLILEQLLTVLPSEIPHWVSEGGPESCSQAVALAEEFLLWKEMQVSLEEASGRVSEAGQDLSEIEQRQLRMGLKEEEDGEASPLVRDKVKGPFNLLSLWPLSRGCKRKRERLKPSNFLLLGWGFAWRRVAGLRLQPDGASLERKNLSYRKKTTEQFPSMKTECQDIPIGEGPAWRGMAAHDLQAGSIGGFLRRRPGDHPAAEGSLSLAQWEAQWQEFLRTVENPHSGWGSPHLPAKPSPWDDAKAFLASFEQVAEACQWPQEEWVTRLLPALSGEAEQAFNGLDVRDREDYGKVKAAILRGDVLSREKQRQQFRRFCYQEAEGPRGAYSQLREMCRGWLRVEKHSKEQILELLILEQLLTVLPPEIRSWVSEGGPESCSQAVALAEEFLLRQETQVPLEEASGRVSRAGQDLPETEQRQLTMELKEEKDGEASPLADVEETVEEFQGNFSLNKSKHEESKGNLRIQTWPPRQEESHAQKTRDKPIPCPGEGFHEIPVQAEESPQKRTNEGHENESIASRTTFIQSMNVISHLDVPSGEKPYSCLECGKGFSRRSALASHQRIHSAGDDQENEDDEDWLQSSQEKAKDEELEGNFRNQGGPKRPEGSHTVEKRDKHMPCQREDFCEEIPMLEETYKCLKCGMNFSDQSQYNIHSQKHNGKKTHKCLECGKSFTCNRNLQRHKRTHTGEKLFECLECGKSFTSNRNLQRHKRTHTGEKPFECSECGKKFSQNETLHKHLRTHTGEKLFECLVCGKKFSQSCHLQRHLRTHTGEKPFECSECRTKFTSKARLRQHQIIHMRLNHVASQPVATAPLIFHPLKSTTESEHQRNHIST